MRRNQCARRNTYGYLSRVREGGIAEWKCRHVHDLLDGRRAGCTNGVYVHAVLFGFLEEL